MVTFWGFSNFFSLCFVFAVGMLHAACFDPTRSDNLAVYWGQNSYGAADPSDTGDWQQRLSYYCQDHTINVFPLAFLDIFFSTGGLPEIDFANTCSSVNYPVFPGTNLANCQFMADDIKACQNKGKIVTLSLGGETSSIGFTSDEQGRSFAHTIWDLFLGGSSSTRPLGDAVLDGIDLDVEGGESTGYAAFVTELRSLASGGSRPFYITGAPQCPFPDEYMGSIINSVGFDALYVQYNNYCDLTNYNNPNAWDFSAWDDWAMTTSPNPNIKIYIGGPASLSAAGSGYVDADTLGNIAQQTRAQYSSFGGVMLWDASEAYANGRYDMAVKQAMGSGTGGTTSSTTTTTPSTTPTTSPTTTTTTTTSTVGTGGCSGIATWDSSTAYNGGAQVIYNEDLWTAQWWTYDDVPGGAAGVWFDDGACDGQAVLTHPVAAAAGPATTTSPVLTDAASSTPAATPALTETVGPEATNEVLTTPAKLLNSRFFKLWRANVALKDEKTI